MASKTWPAKGDKMKFLAANGYDHQLEAAKAKMKEGEILTVNNIRVGSWESSIEFEELTGRWNSVMFELVGEAVAK